MFILRYVNKTLPFMKIFSIEILISCIRSLSMKWYLNWLSKWSSFSGDVKVNSRGTYRENKNKYCYDCCNFQKIDALWFLQKSKFWSWRQVMYIIILCLCWFFITPGLILVGPFHIWRCRTLPRIICAIPDSWFGCWRQYWNLMH